MSVKAERIRRVECDLCGREIDRHVDRDGDAQLPHVPTGCFLPLKWGPRDAKLNLRLTIGECEPNQIRPGDREVPPDVCRPCLRGLFEDMAKRLASGKDVVGAPS